VSVTIDPRFRRGQKPYFHHLHFDKIDPQCGDGTDSIATRRMSGKARPMLIVSACPLGDSRDVESAITRGVEDEDGNLQYDVRVRLAYRVFKMTTKDKTGSPEFFKLPLSDGISFVELIPRVYPESLACQKGPAPCLGRQLVDEIERLAAKAARGQRLDQY
jgi:hypothetical protein